MEDDHHHLHHLHVPVPSNPSMVVIRHAHDDNNNDNTECCIFPPINHENLQISPHSHYPIPESPPSPSPSSSSSSASSSSTFSFSPFDSDTWGISSSWPFDSQLGKRGDFLRWMSFGLDILRSKLFAVASSFRNVASPRRGAFWSIWVPAAAVLVSFWIAMRRRRRRRKRRSLTPNETCLLDIIKEKDERIAQLLHQIAQMNEILIARHKALAAKVTE